MSKWFVKSNRLTLRRLCMIKGNSACFRGKKCLFMHEENNVMISGVPLAAPMLLIMLMLQLICIDSRGATCSANAVDNVDVAVNLC